MLNSYNNLKSTLGEYDALVELKELVLRTFDSQYLISKDQDQFIKNACSEQKISFNPKSYYEAKRLIYHSYISLAYSSFDDFNQSFKRELKEIYGSLELQKEDGETDIDYINRFLNKAIGSRILNDINIKLNYKIIEHYRIIRNEFIHPHTERKEKLYIDLESKYIPQFLTYYSDYKGITDTTRNSITFDDFLLLSMAILNYAKMIVTIAEPKNEYYISKIDSKRFVKYNKDSQRVINSIAQFLVTEYNLKIEKAREIASLYRQTVL